MTIGQTDPGPVPAIIELRQYTLHPGQRDTLIELFDGDLVEPQEELGMQVLGQFRDLDDPNRFVWLRGFSDMASRAAALESFYRGPVWDRHKAAANATMVDSDNVLLLRPVSGVQPTLLRPAADRPGRSAQPPASIVGVTIYSFATPVAADDVAVVLSDDRPGISGAGGHLLLQTEPSANTFPALPVREGEHVLARLELFPSDDAYADDRDRLARSGGRDRMLERLAGRLLGRPSDLRLRPTSRSLIR